MFRCLLTTVLVVFFINSRAQQWEKAKVFHYACENSNYRHVSDQSGNIYIVGELNTEKLILDTIELQTKGALDLFIVKLDSNFNVIWAKSFGSIEDDMITGVSIDKFGDIVICGYFSKTLVIGTDSLTSRGMSDFFIAKLNTDGILVWARTGGSDYKDYSFGRTGGIVIDLNNNIFVTGLFGYENNSGIPNKRTAWFDTCSVKSYGGQDIFLAKYTTYGKIVWVKNFGSYSDDIGDVCMGDNFIYLTGSSEERFKYETGEIFNPDLSSLGFIIKIDTNGKVVWAKASMINNTGIHSVSSLVTDSNGNLFITASYFSSYQAKLKFDTYYFDIAQSINEFYIAKLNKSGKIIWLKRGRGYPNKIIRKNDNQFIIAGFMRGSSSCEGKFLSVPGFYNSIILEIDSNGNLLEFHNFGNTGDNTCDDISLTKDNKILVTGDNWTGALEFDSITLSFTDKKAGFYIARRNFIPKPVGINRVLNSNGFKIYPNPNTGSFTLEIENPSKDMTIEIYNLVGEQIKKAEWVERVNSIDLDVDIGIYLIKVRDKEKVYYRKVSILK